MTDTLGRVLVLIPTYNEKDSLPGVIARVRQSQPRVDVLVLDDNSPDGTGVIAERLSATDPQVHVLHRADKEGLGRAYLAGFGWAQERGYDAVVEMDADGSHQPEQLGGLLAAAEHADLVIGSRWVPGGATHNWPHTRNALSRGANLYARAALGVPVRDATAGYRVYRTSALQAMDLDGVASQGYCFQVDLTLRAVDRGLRVVEVPIDFVEREIGSSKMDGTIVREALGRVTLWGLQRRSAQVASLTRRAVRSANPGATWHELTD
ncbi:polyprenol monophosphomannose synthase [Ornithinimicrobium sp. F0845]|uniref:polyprenol monophosphomannose synthase n=1 Tax=Ornithinimicrobium sp. F0845 TaxID=2926412 RepID=UPI001FF48387|nr:polyprenol monophosphomannose synthase [Ornithinimicrobium sp. F0845]MCK0113219.1 polyprenol monophosphomannose synthase [Ornithinimicrobium sp. F0845]